MFSITIIGAGTIANAPKSNVEVVPFGKSKSFGEIQVRVRSVNIGTVSAKSPGGQKIFSNDELLIVILGIGNASKTKVLDVSGAAGEASLKDEHENEYPSMKIKTQLGFTADIDGQIKQRTRVNPNKEIADVLVFERPADVAKKLMLRLPASNYGGSGFIIFECPRTGKNN